MKIAFTSCMDTLNEPVQQAWYALHDQNPDQIVLLGDSIYMDYEWGHNLEERHNQPKWMPMPAFSERMHTRYQAQWNVASFKQAIANRPVHAIWDDHDFAWNNARGAGPDSGDELAYDYVQRLSREQFRVWREELARVPKRAYPGNPAPEGEVPPDKNAVSIASTVSLSPGIVLHLTDGRSFREEKGGTLLGDAQREALGQAFQAGEDQIHIVASGSVLAGWAKYPDDYKWLREWSQTRRILVLSGDIHEPRFLQPPQSRLFEATASAMAQVPAIGPKKRDVFGMLQIDDDALRIELFENTTRLSSHRIHRAGWTLLA
ncbi:MAG: hypothetical protein RLZZ618_4273 [Pseudomonadota bacterium]|jgi:alkaline phosphatase D